jgi:hypothetical protein
MGADNKNKGQKAMSTSYAIYLMEDYKWCLLCEPLEDYDKAMETYYYYTQRGNIAKVEQYTELVLKSNYTLD